MFPSPSFARKITMFSRSSQILENHPIFFPGMSEVFSSTVYPGQRAHRAQKILLEIFYPDSRGVNVFVGGAKDPDMALKLVRPPGGDLDRSFLWGKLGGMFVLLDDVMFPTSEYMFHSVHLQHLYTDPEKCWNSRSMQDVAGWYDLTSNRSGFIPAGGVQVKNYRCHMRFKSHVGWWLVGGLYYPL